MDTRTDTGAKRGAKEVKTDGRRERAADSRRRILEATLELIREGKPSPTAETISARAGVSLRTLFRHFEEMENLHIEIAALVMKDLRPILSRPMENKPWPYAFYEAIERRAEFYEALMPFNTSLQVFRHRSAALAKQHQRISTSSRELLEANFPREITQDQGLMQALELILSIETWQRLREQQKLGMGEASNLVCRMAKAVLADAGKPIDS